MPLVSSSPTSWHIFPQILLINYMDQSPSWAEFFFRSKKLLRKSRIPFLYGIRMLITVARHGTISWAIWIQSATFYSRKITSRVRLGLPSCLPLFHLPTELVCTEFLSSPMRAACLANFILFYVITVIIRIWYFHASEFEAGCLVVCSAVLSGRSLPTFQRPLLKMEVARTSQTLINYQTTRRDNPEDSKLHRNIVWWRLQIKTSHYAVFFVIFFLPVW
jgi:hypothetical protein